MTALPEDYKDEKKDNEVSESLMADGDMEALMAEIEKQPLVSDKRSLDLLLSEFKDHANFTRQINVLISEDQHAWYRQMRRDGNCFYRAFLLGLFETIESNQDLQLLTRVSEKFMTSLHRCLKFGYEAFTIEDFYYAFMDELQFYQRKLESGDSEYKAQDGMGNTAIDRMANSGHAQYLIFWARMLASLHMRENEKDFAPFIPADKGGFHAWLRSDVEALKSEADHLQTVALSRSIDVPITIYCLENIQKGGPQKVQTIENRKSAYDLLFRPGHYDVLYRKNGSDNSTNQNNQHTQNTDKAATIQSAATDKETDSKEDIQDDTALNKKKDTNNEENVDKDKDAIMTDKNNKNDSTQSTTNNSDVNKNHYNNNNNNNNSNNNNNGQYNSDTSITYDPNTASPLQSRSSTKPSQSSTTSAVSRGGRRKRKRSVLDEFASTSDENETQHVLDINNNNNNNNHNQNGSKIKRVKKRKRMENNASTLNSLLSDNGNNTHITVRRKPANTTNMNVRHGLSSNRKKKKVNRTQSAQKKKKRRRMSMSEDENDMIDDSDDSDGR